MEENKITRLTVQKRDLKRINVYLDGAYAFSLYRETGAWLEVGQILPEEKIRELLETDKKNEVWIKATEFISYKPRTVHETRRKLQNEGFDSQLIEIVINKLIKNGLLDDHEYAVQWVEERNSLKPRSKRALECELRKKGVPEHLIQSAVEEADDFQAACEIAQKRIFRYEGLPKIEFRRKLGAYLSGKGFSFDVISEVTRQLWESIHSSANENNE